MSQEAPKIVPRASIGDPTIGTKTIFGGDGGGGGSTGCHRTSAGDGDGNKGGGGGDKALVVGAMVVAIKVMVARAGMVAAMKGTRMVYMFAGFCCPND